MFRLLSLGGLLSSTTPFVLCSVWWNSWKSNTGSSISVSRYLENSSGPYALLSEKRYTCFASLKKILTAWPIFRCVMCRFLREDTNNVVVIHCKVLPHVYFHFTSFPFFSQQCRSARFGTVASFKRSSKTGPSHNHKTLFLKPGSQRSYA